MPQSDMAPVATFSISLDTPLREARRIFEGEFAEQQLAWRRSRAAQTVLEPDTSLTLRQSRRLFEQAYFAQLLEECGSNISEVAKRAGIDRTYAHKKLEAIMPDAPERQASHKAPSPATAPAPARKLSKKLLAEMAELGLSMDDIPQL